MHTQFVPVRLVYTALISSSSFSPRLGCDILTRRSQTDSHVSGKTRLEGSFVKRSCLVSDTYVALPDLSVFFLDGGNRFIGNGI